MDVTTGAPGADGRDGPPVVDPGAGADADVQQLAQTFAVTPEAVRLAVARVGSGFRDVQRELGGRR
jgi:hypothetical protein